jgi:hypothetical protein
MLVQLPGPRPNRKIDSQEHVASPKMVLLETRLAFAACLRLSYMLIRRRVNWQDRPLVARQPRQHRDMVHERRDRLVKRERRQYSDDLDGAVD